MEWDGPVSALATVGSTAIAFFQWREARKTKSENQGLAKDLEQKNSELEKDHQELKNRCRKLKRANLELLKTVERLKQYSPDSEFLEELKKELEQNISSLEIEIKKIENSFSFCIEAGTWLEKNKQFLSKQAGDKALEIFPNLREPGGSADTKEKETKFYRSIEAHLAWTARNLQECQYIPLKKPIHLFLHKDVYLKAFSYIRDNIQDFKVPDHISSKACKELKESLNELILRIS
ncbi:MAG: hypothetical protein RM021_008625 [Nostoc sp. EkiNYC01]|nr:hypothetical protein [Nostoc sp. EkiNYC01]